MTHSVVSKGVVEPPTGREKLLKAVRDIYYHPSDTIWSTWSDSKLQSWLVENKLVSAPASATALKRHELEKLVSDNYHKTTRSIQSAWEDSDMREWLIKNNYIKSDAQIKKDEVS